MQSNSGQLYTTLQEIIFLPLQMHPGTAELYHRCSVGLAEVRNSQLYVPNRAIISFDTYFNSFYETHWSQLTNVNDVSVEIICSGYIRLELFREAAGQICSVESKIIRCTRLSAFLIPVTTFGETTTAGRLFISITALADSTISNLRYVTATRPKREVSLSLGFCTFKREKAMAANLAALLDEPSAKHNNVKIIVVNQGGSLTDPSLVNLIQHSGRVRLINQNNYGGTGGFTRSILEALRDNSITHHVLIDDDAFLDPRILTTLIAMLSFANDGLVIGGSMLDALQPTSIFEAGGRIKRDGTYEPVLGPIDASKSGLLTAFSSIINSDYNAWWFCAFAIEDVQKVGLPYPFFIHVDDVEYGVRLEKFGCRTVAMPGIAVWHQPYYSKLSNWQTYYGVRNRLIMAALSPDRFVLPKPTTELLWWMLEAIALHDYSGALLRARAVCDFLKGPKIFENNPERLHVDIMKVFSSAPPPVMGHYKRTAQNASRMPESDIRIAGLLTYRLVSHLIFSSSDVAVLDEEDVTIANVGTHPYVKLSVKGEKHQMFIPDRIKLVEAVGASLRAWLLYLFTRHKAANSWRTKNKRYSEKSFWWDALEKWEADQLGG